MMSIGEFTNKVKVRLIKKFGSTEKYLKLKYKIIFDKELDLNNCQTFNEKINWIICNYRNPLYEVCADKINARGYIETKGLGANLTKLYAQYESVDNIDFDKLPAKFVIKTTHSFGGVCVVDDKSKADFKDIKKKLKKSFARNLYDVGREWQYKNLQPRIMAEEYIEPASGEPLLDYKFYCFDGNVRFIHVSADIAKGGSYVMDFYSPDWSHLAAQRVGKVRSNGMEKPRNLDEMIRIAELLSADFPHVRVDLYNVNNKIYIGELTFTTAAGTGRFTDDRWDYEFGKYMRLPINNYEIWKA